MLNLFIENFHTILAWLGVIAAYIGLLFVFLGVLPTQLAEAKKKDGIRNTRLALPALTFTLLFLYVPTVVWYTYRLMYFHTLNAQADFFRFVVGLAIFITGVLLLVIYKKGGMPTIQ